MIIITNPINIYGKKVITDIATRTGAQTTESYSYGYGLADVTRTFWNDPDDLPTNIDAHLEEQTDFDADVIRSSIVEDDIVEESDADEEQTFDMYDPARDPIDFKKYNRRLEDVPTVYIKRYLGNIIYNICNRESSFRTYKRKHKIQACLMNSEDDDYTELADLIVNDREEWSLGQKQTAKRNLSYVVKRLHNMSCYCKVHMLSYIAAYQRAQKFIDDNHRNGGIRTLTSNLVVDNGVYLCDADGYITKRVYSENKNKHAKAMFAWINGEDCEYSAYYQNYLDLVHYCDILDIDLINDDMTKYGPEFIDSLTVMTVTPNKQYNRRVYAALRGNLNTVQESVSESQADIIKNTVEIFKQLCRTDVDIRSSVYRFGENSRKLFMNYAIGINSYYAFSVLGKALDPAKYHWESGFLYYDDSLVTMNAAWLGDPAKTVMTNIQCIFSELGYVLALVPGDNIYYLTINNAYENMQQMCENNRDYVKVDWVRTTS